MGNFRPKLAIFSNFWVPKQYYNDEENVGKKLPNPKIKQARKLTNGSKYHFLTWEGEEGGNWVYADFFSNITDDGEFNDLTCGTRKSRDKRICRYIVGIFLGAFPCGIVPLWDELFGSESISQVYGVCIEFLETLPEEERKKITDLIYDDNCHLSKFASNEKDHPKMK